MSGTERYVSERNETVDKINNGKETERYVPFRRTFYWNGNVYFLMMPSVYRRLATHMYASEVNESEPD